MSSCLGLSEVFSLENMKVLLFSDMSGSILFFSLFVSEIIILFNYPRPMCALCVCVLDK